MSHVDEKTGLVKVGAQKAIYGSIIAAILAFITPIVTTVDAGQPITLATWLHAIVALLVFGGTVFGVVYQSTNKII